jgi:DNA modification methylase
MINLMLGDCLDEMKKLDDNSVDSIVTDPPYGLSFMGKAWDKTVPSKEVWEEALRVLKPGGHLLAFAGTRTQHRMAVNIEDAGFEIRDMIAWVYGSGFPKSLNVSKAIDGKILTGRSDSKSIKDVNTNLRDGKTKRTKPSNGKVGEQH